MRRVFIAFALVLGSVIPTLAQATAKQSATLVAASSPFEDMVEFARDKDDAGIVKSLAAADARAAAVKQALPAADGTRFAELLQANHKAAADKDYRALSMNAVEALRLLLEHVQGGVVPKEVGLLDYAGFKLQVLVDTPQPDWEAMGKTAEQAAAWWGAVKAKVTDVALRDAFSSTVEGLAEATKDHNPKMLHFAAQMDLDLVDLLEGYFERKH